MQTHSSGAITGSRDGALVTAQSFKFDFANNPTATPIKLLTIDASPAKPVAYRTRAVVMTPFNSTTNTLSVGTSSGGTQILNAVDIKAAAGTNYAPTNNVVIATSQVEIWGLHTSTGGAGTAGEVAIIVELAEINIKQPTNQGA